jgi:hypothetical protein
VLLRNLRIRRGQVALRRGAVGRRRVVLAKGVAAQRDEPSVWDGCGVSPGLKANASHFGDLSVKRHFSAFARRDSLPVLSKHGLTLTHTWRLLWLVWDQAMSAPRPTVRTRPYSPSKMAAPAHARPRWRGEGGVQVQAQGRESGVVGRVKHWLTDKAAQADCEENTVRRLDKAHAKDIGCVTHDVDLPLGVHAAASGE